MDPGDVDFFVSLIANNKTIMAVPPGGTCESVTGSESSWLMQIGEVRRRVHSKPNTRESTGLPLYIYI